MTTKRILVVDDDKSILRMLEYGLTKMAEDIEVFTARDMSSALSLVENQHFDLVLTDYMMPGMTGVDLARAVRRMSPETQVVLMTAYGTSKLRDTTSQIGFDGFLDKPFDIDEVRRIIKSTTLENTPEPPPAEAPAPVSAPAEAPAPVDVSSPPSVDGLLQDLLVNAGARIVMLVNAAGEPLKIVGQIDPKKIADIAAQVAVNFRQTSDLSSLLDNHKKFRSGMYEGDAFNIYICDVNEEALLAVIFNVKLRPGVVWFYSKQTAAGLASLLNAE